MHDLDLKFSVPHPHGYDRDPGPSQHLINQKTGRHKAIHPGIDHDVPLAEAHGLDNMNMAPPERFALVMGVVNGPRRDIDPFQVFYGDAHQATERGVGFV